MRARPSYEFGFYASTFLANTIWEPFGNSNEPPSGVVPVGLRLTARSGDLDSSVGARHGRPPAATRRQAGKPPAFVTQWHPRQRQRQTICATRPLR